MGLLFADTTGGEFKAKSETKLLNQLGCKACPLNHTPGKIDATGADKPLIYILGEAAGREEEEQRLQFVGTAGKLLRQYIPKKYLPQIRWNNVLNCHPPGNKTPERTETECCRPRIVVDIERTKPKVIFGFGGTPLTWVGGFSGITFWRGRRMPVKVGSHTCWYYAFLHPSYLHRIHRADRYSGEVTPSDEEFITELDLMRAFDELDDLPPPEVHTPEMAKANVECITKIRDIELALAWAAKQKSVGQDYETNCIRPFEAKAKILTASVGTLERAFAFPMMHPGAGYSREQREDIMNLWKRFLMNAPCRKMVHNLAFEMEWSAEFFGTEVLRARPWEDTANAAAIVDERSGDRKKVGPFSLEFLVQQYFGFNIKKVSNVNRSNLENTDLPTVLLYNGIDAKYHDGLWYKLWEAIKQEGLEEAYRLAVRRVPTVTLAQVKGVPVDQSRVKVLQKKYNTIVEGIEDKIFAVDVVGEFKRKTGAEFSPSSNPDIVDIFEKFLHCKEVNVVDKYTKKEKKSCDESVLSQIKHPLAQLILDYRGATHQRSTYIEPLLKGFASSVIFPDDLIHAQFNTFFAETGRLSCSTPNLQNFPKRDAEAKEVRYPIRAPQGCLILSFDYGQIEARVIAMFTQDKRFCKALWERYDVHQDWAERIAYDYPARVGGKKNLTDKKAMKDFRTDIKNQWTFPLFFGAQLKSVAGYLSIPENVLRPHYKKFWREFEGVKNWQEELKKFYYEYGYVECLTGRRRHGPLSLNQILNSPVQGTACEIVMDAMSRLSETGDPLLQPELQIHDDLTFIRVPEEQIDVVAEKVIDKMLDVPFDFINVPITAEMSVGENWMQLEEVGTYSSDTWRK
jgi:uracil-DNA glycosylase family 4